jgi:hypothetical protein
VLPGAGAYAIVLSSNASVGLEWAACQPLRVAAGPSSPGQTVALWADNGVRAPCVPSGVAVLPAGAGRTWEVAVGPGDAAAAAADLPGALVTFRRTSTAMEEFRGSAFADIFASTPKDGGHNLRAAVAAIESEGRGVILYVPSRGSVKQELESYWLAKNPPSGRGGDGPVRELGLGCQVLHDLGVRRLKLLTNNPLKMAGLHGFGLEVVARLPLASTSA